MILLLERSEKRIVSNKNCIFLMSVNLKMGERKEPCFCNNIRWEHPWESMRIRYLKAPQSHSPPPFHCYPVVNKFLKTKTKN